MSLKSVGLTIKLTPMVGIPDATGDAAAALFESLGVVELGPNGDSNDEFANDDLLCHPAADESVLRQVFDRVIADDVRGGRLESAYSRMVAV